jgi:hypothetical protein
MSIEAMKLALEALEGLVDLAHEAGFPCDRAEAAITSLRQAIEQAEKQEPVAWMIWLHGPAGLLEHKQLAELEFERRNKEYPDENRKLVPLYTIPQPQREWVGLTDEEIEIVSGDYTESEGFKHGARWALDQLKEKNT